MNDVYQALFIPVDDVRDKLIGACIIDIEPGGRVIHLVDSQNRCYSINTDMENRVSIHDQIPNKLKLHLVE